MGGGRGRPPAQDLGDEAPPGLARPADPRLGEAALRLLAVEAQRQDVRNALVTAEASRARPPPSAATRPACGCWTRRSGAGACPRGGRRRRGRHVGPGRPGRRSGLSERHQQRRQLLRPRQRREMAAPDLVGDHPSRSRARRRTNGAGKNRSSCARTTRVGMPGQAAGGHGSSHIPPGPGRSASRRLSATRSAGTSWKKSRSSSASAGRPASRRASAHPVASHHAAAELPRHGDHGTDEHEQTGADPVSGQRGDEAAEGVPRDHDVPVAGGRGGHGRGAGVEVGGRPGRQVRRQRLVAQSAERRRPRTSSGGPSPARPGPGRRCSRRPPLQRRPRPSRGG